jgi:WD40 repeat protein
MDPTSQSIASESTASQPTASQGSSAFMLKVCLVALLLAGAAAGWYGYFMRQEGAELGRRLEQLELQVQQAQQQRQNTIEQRAAAERQRLIAERQRQDAIEQRITAERERLNAEHQRREALEQRAAAERERLNAEHQRREALEQRAAAERERLNAEKQRQEAIQQRTVAERLRLLAVGRSLAAEAVKLHKGGEYRLSALLALQAYVLTMRNGGPVQAPSIYNALRQALFSLAPEGRSLSGHEDEVRAIVFDPDGKRLVSAGDDGAVRVWSLAGGMAGLLGVGSARMQALAFDGAGRYLAAGDSDGSVWLWDMNLQEDLDLSGSSDLKVAEKNGAGRGMRKIDAGSGITSLAFGIGPTLAGGRRDGGVLVWDLDRSTASAKVASGDSSVGIQPLAYVGQTLVWAGANGALQAQRGDWAAAVAFGEDLGQLSALALASDGRIAAGNAAGDIVVWPLPAKKPTVILGHASRITSLAFSPDGAFLASGSLDNTVKIWDLAVPNEEPVTIDHGAWVWAVAFAPEGDRLASAGADRTVRLWPTQLDRMATDLCLRLDLGLSRGEWDRYVGADIPYEDTCGSLTAGSIPSFNPRETHAHSTR